MYYYGGYSGNGYGNSCGCSGGYQPTGYGYGYGGYGSSAAIILVLFILLVIIIGSRVNVA